MHIFNATDVENYMKQDWIMQLLKSCAEKSCVEKNVITVATNEWLMTDVNKRMIYAEMYGDFLIEKQNKKVLDAGGVSLLTNVLAENTEYTLVDLLAHGGKEYLKQHKNLHVKLKALDWYLLEMDEDYDVILANDIFPNVDQRMELFIEKMLPHCRELRMSVTYYNTLRFYVTRRLDAEEILTMLCYDGDMVSSKLKKYLSEMIDTKEKDLVDMKTDKSSIYENGRQVAYIRMRGGIQ